MSSAERDTTSQLDSVNHRRSAFAGAAEAAAAAHVQQLPAAGPFRLSALYRPVDFVSGDFFDVRRLDENHAAVIVADATGHSLPAAALTVLLRQTLTQHVHRDSDPYGLAGNVLSALNETLLAADTGECRFVALAFAVLHLQTREVTLARAGTPFPVLRRASGALELAQSYGALVGITPGATYETQTLNMATGDALLLFSDGLEALMGVPLPVDETDSAAAPVVAPATAAPPASAAAAVITNSAWYRRLAAAGPDAALRDLAARQQSALQRLEPLDDLTVVAISAT